MGGAAAGRLASQVATDALEDCFAEGLADLPEGGEQALLARCIAQANRAVYDESLKDPANRGMGTTAVCVLVRQGTVHVAHVGDSRAYLLHSGGLFQLTKDHSMVQELVEQGSITEQESYTHPQKNLITRALGVARTVTADCGEVEVSEGDVLMLCTDGLSNYVSADAIAGTLAGTPFYEAADELVEKALAAGGMDNITVLLVGVQADAEEEKHG